jgi:hypothetical protein
MQFETKVFVRVKNTGARVADSGGVLFFATLLLVAVFGGLKYRITPQVGIVLVFLWIGSIVLVFVGRRMAKGNLFEIGLSDTVLVLLDDSIHVGNEVYSFDQVTDLDFWIEGYDGMIGPQFKGYRSFRNQGRLSGADNKIHFRADGRRHLYQFYLRNDVDMQQLGRIFRSYYSKGVPFRECNRGGPTFLFQQVRSKKEFEEMKRREGYRTE